MYYQSRNYVDEAARATVGSPFLVRDDILHSYVNLDTKLLAGMHLF